MLEPNSTTRRVTPVIVTLLATLSGFVAVGYGAAEAFRRQPQTSHEVPRHQLPPVNTVQVTPEPKARPISDAPAQPAETGDSHVLLIGDSHVAQTYGQSLDLLLRSRANTTVATVGSCGSNPDAFLQGKKTHCGLLRIDGSDMNVAKRKRSKTPEVTELLRKQKPDLTIVELGANLIRKAHSSPKATAAQLAELARKVSSVGQCIWVGPPNGLPKQKPVKKIDNVYRLLHENVGEYCEIMDSRATALPFLDYASLSQKAKRKGDGRHFDHIGLHGRQAARRWALATFEMASSSLQDIENRQRQSALTGKLASADSHGLNL